MRGTGRAGGAGRSRHTGRTGDGEDGRCGQRRGGKDPTAHWPSWCPRRHDPGRRPSRSLAPGAPAGIPGRGSVHTGADWGGATALGPHRRRCRAGRQRGGVVGAAGAAGGVGPAAGPGRLPPRQGLRRRHRPPRPRRPVPARRRGRRGGPPPGEPADHRLPDGGGRGGVRRDGPPGPGRAPRGVRRAPGRRRLCRGCAAAAPHRPLPRRAPRPGGAGRRPVGADGGGRRRCRVHGAAPAGPAGQRPRPPRRRDPRLRTGPRRPRRRAADHPRTRGLAGVRLVLPRRRRPGQHRLRRRAARRPAADRARGCWAGWTSCCRGSPRTRSRGGRTTCRCPRGDRGSPTAGCCWSATPCPSSTR